MFRKLWILLVALALAIPAYAQGAPLVAFTNSSGQLIVAGADGVTRWIVTNPGETLDPTLGYTWSPDGSRLFFAVDLGSAVSIRIGDPATMSVTEVGQAAGDVSGGQWADNGLLVFGSDVAIPGTITINGTVASPYTQNARSLSPDGNNAILLFDGSGIALQRPNGGIDALGPNTTALNAIWSDTAPIVAFSGQTSDGTPNLMAFNVSNDQVAMLVGGSLPMEPIAWVPNSAGLLYRDTTGTIRFADVACLQSGCSSNPLETGAQILPASAQNVVIAGNAVVYTDGNQLKGVPIACAQSNDCNARTVIIDSQTSPRTGVFVAGNRVIYTGYQSDANNQADRHVRTVDASCIASANCQPQPLLNGAVAGAISDDSSAMVADILGSGVHIVNLSNLTTLYLTDSGYSNVVQSARWN
ncbi:MAG: hypothetical protein H6670_14730 [Anaerolineaceae bacterium]|nr:hypothetical protein [Anaerolineaceae bacterium]